MRLPSSRAKERPLAISLSASVIFSAIGSVWCSVADMLLSVHEDSSCFSLLEYWLYLSLSSYLKCKIFFKSLQKFLIVLITKYYVDPFILDLNTAMHSHGSQYGLARSHYR